MDSSSALDARLVEETVSPRRSGVHPHWRRATLALMGIAAVGFVTAAVVIGTNTSSSPSSPSSSTTGHYSSSSSTAPVLDATPALTLPQDWAAEFVASAEDGAHAYAGKFFSRGGRISWEYEGGEVAPRGRADDSHPTGVPAHERLSVTYHGGAEHTRHPHHGSLCRPFAYHVPTVADLTRTVRRSPDAAPVRHTTRACRPSESRYTAVLDRVVYTVCVGADGLPRSVANDDFAAEITSFKVGAQPAPAGGAETACQVADADAAVAAERRHFAEHAPGADVSEVWREAHERDAASRVVPMASKHCVFLHGAGETPGPDTTSFPGYWGKKLNKKLDQCLSFTYIHKDTKNNAWDDRSLMQSYCDAATAFSSNSVAQNVIIFSHSMGNLIFSAALGNGLCSLGSTASWYSVSGPMEGSKTCDVIQTLCDDTHPSEALKAIMSLLSYCDGTNPSRAYLSMKTTNNYAVAKKGFSAADGVMCGDSVTGLSSFMSLGLAAIAAIAKFGEPNDGMVTRHSCAYGAAANYPRTYTSRYFTGGLNHGDTTGINGDGWYGEDRMPLTWYSLRG